jgi:outer membrane murein-binding lipoprotein Lpp
MRKPTRAQAPKIALHNRRAARQKIDAKISVLKNYLENGTPHGAFVPKSLEQFRVWTDDGLNLQAIGSKSTLYQGWNRDVRQEILSLMRSLTAQTGKTKRKDSTHRLRTENRELKFTLKQLAGEVHKTRQELQAAQRENRRKDQRIADLKEEISELTARLKQHSGLYSVK